MASVDVMGEFVVRDCKGLPSAESVKGLEVLAWLGD